MTRDQATRLTTVAVVDNHEAVRSGVAAEVEKDPRFEVVGSYEGVDELLAEERLPDMVVLDLHLGRDDSLATPHIPELVRRGSQVVMYTSEERPVVLRLAVLAGASGVVLKNDSLSALLNALSQCREEAFVCSSVLAQALVTDPALVTELSPREVEVLRGLDDGLTQKQVASVLGITNETVKSHLKSVRTKFLARGADVGNSNSMVRLASEEGWLTD